MERITIEKWRDFDGCLWDTATDCLAADKVIEHHRKTCQVRAAAQVFVEKFTVGLDGLAHARALDALRQFLQTPEGREAVRDLSRVLW